MRINRTVPFVFAGLLVLSACTGGDDTGGTSMSSSSSEAASSVSSAVSQMPETSNVTYIGTVARLEASIYMQGTHTLTTSDGTRILLDSSTTDLDTYVGSQVEAFGSVQPTVESNGTIMHVIRIDLVRSSSSSLSSSASVFCGGIAGLACPLGMECVDDPSDTCDPLNGGADCGGMCIRSTTLGSSSSSVSSSAVSSSAQAAPPSSSSLSSSMSQSSKSSSSSSVSSKSSVSMSSAPSVTVSPELEQQIALMAKQNYDASFWTQTYCTGHIGFCLPAHKNWYYKSFGATTSNQWHVEFGMTDIEALGDGPIVLNLVAGTSASAGGTDGQATVRGSQVTGYKDWEGRHFEITADARLRAAVEYMISHITQNTAE